MQFDNAMVNDLLSTTRSVRKRLDLRRPVPRSVVEDCLELAIQAPTGGNRQNWRWVVVDDVSARKSIADLYRLSASSYLEQAAKQAKKDGDRQSQRVFDSALYLAEHLGDVPVHVIPCYQGKLPENAPHAMLAGVYGSIFPAVWNLQLALRARGLGSTLTTLHLSHEREMAQLLKLPADFVQMALLPVAYTHGTEFKRAQRPPVSTVTYWNGLAPS
jgi:nitroreductase